MRAPNRVAGNVKLKSIPPGVYKLRYYLDLFLRHGKNYASFDPHSFWLGILMGVLKAPIGAAKIFITGLLVDSIVTYYTQPVFIQIFGFQLPFPLMYLILLFLMARTGRILESVFAISNHRIRNDSMVKHKLSIVEKFHRLNSQEIDKEGVKDKITKIESYWFNNAASFYVRLSGVTEFVISISIAFFALFTISPLVAFLVVLVPLPELFKHFQHYRRHARFVDDIAPVMLERNYYYQALTDARTFPERKINSVYSSLIDRFEYTAELVSSGYKHVLTRGEKSMVKSNLVDHVMLIVLKCGVLVTSLAQRAHVGTITATLGYIDSLYSNSFDLMNNIISMYDELTFIEYLYDFMDTKGFADNLRKGKHLNREKIPEIAFDNVTFSYHGSGKTILENASAVIKPGEKVMILGKDGTGKSSLLSLIAGLYQLNEGSIRFNTIPMHKLARGQVKRRISVVPEDFARYYMTLRENIVLGDLKKKFDAALYKKALEITGLTIWLKENHIDDQKTILGNYFEGSVAISSGHWQRIAIARAIYRNRDIFILDQPFTYIDRHSVEEIFPKLLKFVGKRTLIFISEDHHYAKDFNSVYELEERKLVKKK
jgi:ATP-binding cassette subfamily B protein